jgi:lysozyme
MKHSIIEQLELHEGIRLKPYKDTVGKLTIGIGRNLDDVGLSKAEAYYLAQNDIRRRINRLEKFEWYRNLDEVRKKVIIDMAFNLGMGGLLSFKNMIKAIKLNDFPTAAVEMLNSKWANQVGVRAKRLSKMMKTGQDYELD